MTDFYKIIKKAKPDLKPVSIQRYVSNINKLLTDINKPNNIKSLTDINSIITHLNTKAPSTKKAYINAIIVALKGGLPDDPSISIYQEKRDTLNKEYFDEKSKNIKNGKEKERMITMKEWDGLIKELNKKITSQKLRSKTVLNKNEFNLMLQHLLVSLYFKYPFRNDFALMKVVTPLQYKRNKDPQYNYFIDSARGSKFILNNYKTNKTYGSQIIDVDKDTVKLIRQFLKISPNKEMLIVDNNGVPLSRNRLSKFLISTFQNYLKKPIGTQMLRKSYLSSKYGDVVKEEKKDSKLMGHSVGTQQKIYVKTD